jgi:hypothetical protein
VLACWTVIGSLVIVIAVQRHVVQSVRGSGQNGLPISRADDPDPFDTQPNLVAPQAVQAACESAAVGRTNRDAAVS